jgi:uncharacterized repeat protein (TIGR01451 family)
MDNSCPAPTAAIAKTVEPAVVLGEVLTTYTYTISIENTGNQVLNLNEIEDLLPEGFSYEPGTSSGGDDDADDAGDDDEGFSYEPGTSSGGITVEDPATSIFQDRQRLVWNFNPDNIQFQPGETKLLVFNTQAQVMPGDYWNEVWLNFDEFSERVYSWPTAEVRVMSALETAATDGESTISSEIWLGADSYILNEWDITR